MILLFENLDVQKRERVVICMICEACLFNKVENVLYEYIKENWTKNWTLWHALNDGFPWQGTLIAYAKLTIISEREQ